MAQITMPEARFIDRDGKETIVSLPGMRGEEGAIAYRPLLHRGGLTCRFCDAAVHYNAGSEIICGQTDLKGPSPHFHTNPGQKHDESCLWKFYINEQRPAGAYDDARGFRIHLNTGGYSALFAAKAGPYYRTDDKKLMVRDPSLRDMRPVSIDSVATLAGFIAQGQFGRLRASRVLHNGWDLPWAQFFVRYDRRSERGEKRFASLVDRLKRGGPQPCLMEFNVAAGVWPPLFDAVPPVKSAPVSLGCDRHGRRETAYPRVYLKNRDNTLVTTAFSQPGSYLAMGYARLKTYQDERSVRHILSIDVTDPRQVQKVRLEDIVRQVRAKAMRSVPHQGPVPSL